jgi:outer membrane receptor for ferrienterochelin and colicin
VSEAATELETLIVTGTHIRGAGEAASPIVVMDREAIERTGYATVAEALSALPQNLGGAGTPDGLLSLSDGLGTNSAAATGVNLRGLGADATLVLVNGRRMAGTGSKGGFTDVSALPTAAVERVDVLLDGASALYGSDAVGGVFDLHSLGGPRRPDCKLRWAAHISAIIPPHQASRIIKPAGADAARSRAKLETPANGDGTT